jgi:hemoglobin
MTTQNDIATFADIKLLVDSFYAHVRKDDLLKTIFEETIGDHWDAHLERMYRFWQSMLFDQHTYQGNPLLMHLKLPIEKPHYGRWIALFNATVDEHFAGTIANLAKKKAAYVIAVFEAKISYYQEHKEA